VYVVRFGCGFANLRWFHPPDHLNDVVRISHDHGFASAWTATRCSHRYRPFRTPYPFLSHRHLPVVCRIWNLWGVHFAQANVLSPLSHPVLDAMASTFTMPDRLLQRRFLRKKKSHAGSMSSSLVDGSAFDGPLDTPAVATQPKEARSSGDVDPSSRRRGWWSGSVKKARELRQNRISSARGDPDEINRPAPSLGECTTTLRRRSDSNAPTDVVHSEGESLPRHGAAVLFEFLRGLASDHAPLIARPLKQTLRVDNTERWQYNLTQWHETDGLDKVRRELVPRLYRVGTKLEGPGWAYVLLGHEFSRAPSSRQIHVLQYTLQACCCLWCLVKDAKAEQSFSSVGSNNDDLGTISLCQDLKAARLDAAPTFKAVQSDAAGGNKGTLYCNVEPSDRIVSHVSPNVPKRDDYSPDLQLAQASVSSSNATWKWSIPAIDDLHLIGDLIEDSKLEIGLISNLSSRGRAKFSLSPMIQSFLGHSAYAGPMPMADMYTSMLKFATAHCRQNKGKPERKVYIQGGLLRFPLCASVFFIAGTPHNSDEQESMGILAGAQVVHLFYGVLVLEGSFDAVISTNIEYYIGFGEDGKAQALYSGGQLGVPRTLGIKEICNHTTLLDYGPQNVLLR
jgi:hypothetical protein